MIQGADVVLGPDVVFTRPELVSLGNRVAIDKGFYCTTRIDLGDYIHIGPYVTCIGGTDGHFVAQGFNNIMAGARIVCASDRFDDTGLFGALIPAELKGTQIVKPVVMGPFSNIATNAVVLPGSRLRRGVLLTVGSVLIGDTEEWGIYKGNPAILVKRLENPQIIINRAKTLGYEF